MESTRILTLVFVALCIMCMTDCSKYNKKASLELRKYQIALRSKQTADTTASTAPADTTSSGTADATTSADTTTSADATTSASDTTDATTSADTTTSAADTTTSADATTSAADTTTSPDATTSADTTTSTETTTSATNTTTSAEPTTSADTTTSAAATSSGSADTTTSPAETTSSSTVETTSSADPNAIPAVLPEVKIKAAANSVLVSIGTDKTNFKITPPKNSEILSQTVNNIDTPKEFIIKATGSVNNTNNGLLAEIQVFTKEQRTLLGSQNFYYTTTSKSWICNDSPAIEIKQIEDSDWSKQYKANPFNKGSWIWAENAKSANVICTAKFPDDFLYTSSSMFKATFTILFFVVLIFWN